MAESLIKLKDKTVLITGSSKGIGKATALLAARYGAKIAINYTHDQTSAESTAAEVDRLGGGSIILRADVSRENQVEVMIGQFLSQFGHLDILINNAGLISWKPLLKDHLGPLHRIIDVNVKGIINTTYCAAKVMKGQKKGGVIVNIASGAGKTAYPDLATYSASKFAVLGFTQAVAQELAPNKIRVYAVCPGMTATSMTNQVGLKPERVATRVLETAIESLHLKPGEDTEIYR